MQKILSDLSALCKGKGEKKTIGSGTFIAFLDNHLKQPAGSKAVREVCMCVHVIIYYLLTITILRIGCISVKG